MAGGDDTRSLSDAPGGRTSTSTFVTGGEPPLDIAPGDHLGRYTVRRRIGGGGMGEVYAAHDPDLDRLVAVKVLKPGAAGDSPVARARFQREAQAMARLNHPNVVSVHDAGAVGDRVFVAMELVNGPTLAAWLAERPRPQREVVDVFLQAARGLAAAHAAGIVHRDFKPSNVILGDRVRVADFGLARTISDPESFAAAAPATPALDKMVTTTGHWLGTPAYMAPEQRAGAPATAASDQYAFALALREALSGARAGDPRPARAVPKWLRAIVERGLAPRPEDRYPSMRELLVDLGRDPARARRRLLAGTAALGLVAVALVGGRRGAASPPCEGAEALIATVWDDDSRRRVAQAFRALDRPYAEDTFARVDEALRARQAAWARAHREACEATHVRREQSEILLDLRMRCLAGARTALVALVDALGRSDVRALERAAQAASDVADVDACADTRALAAAVPPPRDPRVAAQVEGLRAELAQVEVLNLLGQYKPGLSHGRELLARARQAGYAPVLAGALLQVGRLETLTGEIDAAIETLYELVRVGSEAQEDVLVARGLAELAFAVGSQKLRFEAAEALHRTALAAAARAGNPPRLVRVVHAYRAHVLVRKGDLRSALFLRLMVLALAGAERGPESREAGMALGYVAGALARLGHTREARPLYDRALAILEKALGPHHPWFIGMLGNAAGNLSDGFAHDEAGLVLERILAEVKRVGPNDREVAEVLLKLADVRIEQRRFVEARELLAHAMRIDAQVLGAEHPNVADGQVLLGVIERHERRPAAAHDHYQRALAIQRKVFGGEHAKIAGTLVRDAEALIDLGRLSEARGAIDEAIAIDRKTIGEAHTDHSEALLARAALLGAERRFGEAPPLYRRALALLEAEHGADSPALVEPLAGLCEALFAAGDRPGARAPAERAVRLAGKSPPDVRARAELCLARAGPR